ncbi:MAG TPA: hypothetical protein VH080_08080, partial [Gemmatimonadaceae bacterium]|nr:hypothetical protein [Gemmatimonadaceae bacterium]
MSLLAVIAISSQMSSALLSPRVAATIDDSLRTHIENRIGRVTGATVGVAFRDLSNGDTLYIGADERFH